MKIVGVGGGGGNAVNWLIRNSIPGEVVCVDTDAKDLAKRLALKKIRMTLPGAATDGGQGLTLWGEKAALGSIGPIERIFVEADIAVLISTLGGGTGSGALPVIAKAARNMGALTVVMATTPFQHEGSARREHALKAMGKLKTLVDIWIEISNEDISKFYAPKDLGDLLAVPDRAFYLGIWVLNEMFSERESLEILRGSGEAVVGWGSTVTAALANTWPRKDIRDAKTLMALSVGEKGAKGHRNFKLMNQHFTRQFPQAERLFSKRIARVKFEEDYRVVLLAVGI